MTYACPNCGSAKISVEMMLEGYVDENGTLTVRNKESLNDISEWWNAVAWCRACEQSCDLRDFRVEDV
jgi:transcription elongation factor Elf1